MSKLKQSFFSKIYKTKKIFSSDFWNYHLKDSVLIFYSDFNKNWGDFVNLFLFQKLVNKPVISSKRIYTLKHQNNPIFGIGSILNANLNNSVIWGSGFIKEPVKIQGTPKRILALRGKLSAKVFEDNNIPHNGVYGDPALLFPTFYKPMKEKKYELGIVPHYTELNEFIKAQPIIAKLGIKIISPIVEGDKVYNIIDEICECEHVISSSLHGLILADAYGVPSARFTFKNKIIGGSFKYDDYYSGVGIKSYNTISINKLEEINLEEILLQTELKKLNFSPELLKNSLLDYVNNNLSR